MVLVQPEEEGLEGEEAPVEGEHDHGIAEVTHRLERGGGRGEQDLGGLNIVGEEVGERCAWCESLGSWSKARRERTDVVGVIRILLLLIGHFSSVGEDERGRTRRGELDATRRL